jgi:N-acetylmuramoyl-L-alanine amidase
MLPFFWYMLKVIICSGILFGYYWFFLRNKIFHQYNRFYLLAAVSLSLLLPLLKINFWQPAADTNQAIRVLQAVSAGDEYMNNIVLTAKRSNWSLEQLYPVVYILVSLIFFLVMLRTLFLIRTLLKKYPVQQVEEITFINTQDDSTPFSFLKYIFWNSSIDLDTTTGRQIFKHEVAHIQEKHTHDKLFVNIILIFCWCNPFFWLYRKELNMIHEFIADKKAVEDSDTSAFAAMILQAAYPKHRFELANNFFYSPIKRRLHMLTKNKNPRVNYIGRIMVLPLALLIFAAFTFKTKSSSSIYDGKKITVVIDAGHGGQDAGAKSADGILEKDLTLAIAKKVKELNSNDAVEIVLVRDGDVYMNPQQKVEFSKTKNADLFISFHIDNGPKQSANKYTGMSVWVAKDEFSNAAKSKVFASAILNEFSNNYELPVMSPLNQRQQGVYVLQANTCPAVLIETGFINNEKDLAYLQTNAAKETIAKNVLAAIEKFASTNNLTKNLLQKEVIVSSSNPFLKDTVPTKIITGVNPKAAAPLYIVNGKETDKAVALDIKPEEIEGIRVIKEDMALRVYGEKGKNGVVIINTKPNYGTPAKSLTGSSITVHGDNIEKFLGANPLIIIDNIEYQGKTPNEISAIIGLRKLENVDVYGAEEGMKIYGEKAKEGAIIGTTNRAKENASDLKAVNQEPKMYIGNNAGGKINLDYLKTIKEISVTDGYILLNASMYIQGPGFPDKVVQITLNSASLASAQSVFDKCQNGTQIIFDNIQVKDKNGVPQTLQSPPGYIVYDRNNQNPDASINQTLSDNKVFTQVEQNPQFTGGEPAWRNYLQKNLKAVTPVDEGWKAGVYKVVVKFIVHTDGTVSDVTTEDYIGTKTALHCIEVIKNAPKWQPAVQNGRKVNAYKKQPITFVIEEG